MRLPALIVGTALAVAGAAAAAESTGQKVEQQGKASYYARSLQGKKTASGTPLNNNAMAAASPTLPLGAKAKVTNVETSKSVEVKVEDRGPYAKGRVIDVSRKAAAKLDMKYDGTAPVKVEAKPEDQPTPALKSEVAKIAEGQTSAGSSR